MSGADVFASATRRGVKLPDGFDQVTGRVTHTRPGQADAITKPPDRLVRTTKELDSGRGCRT